MKELYLCSGKKADCKKTNCYMNGGLCYLTIDIQSRSELEVSEYETDIKRVINSEIVSFTYHNIEWLKCFKGMAR